jgi:hypothetical protein
VGPPGGGADAGWRRSVASGPVPYDWSARGVAGTILAGGVVLVVLDVTDRGIRRFFEQSALATDAVSGLLVLLFTLLVVDQVVRRRALKARSKAVAAHVAIVLAQGIRTADAAASLEAGKGDRESAMDEQRTYMLMLLVAAPVLIEAPQARRFLESAQSLAGTIARILVPSLPATFLRLLPADLDGAVQALRASAAPLLSALTALERTAVGEPGPEADTGHVPEDVPEQVPVHMPAQAPSQPPAQAPVQLPAQPPAQPDHSTGSI